MPLTPAFTDINADGRVDVVFQWHTAQASTISRRVFLNRGSFFDEVPSDRYRLPNVPFAEIDDRRARGYAIGDLARLEDIDNDGLVDVVVPGTFCLNIPGANSCAPVDPADPNHSLSLIAGKFSVFPAMYFRNAGKVPDLLTSVDESGGSHTDVAYAAARVGPV